MNVSTSRVAAQASILALAALSLRCSSSPSDAERTRDSAQHLDVNAIGGFVDAVGVPGDGSAVLYGWACTVGQPVSIAVHVYAGGPAGSGSFVTAFTANQPNEQAVSDQCQDSGVPHRFAVSIDAATVAAHAGQSIWLHGINVAGGANSLLSNSGSFSFPSSRKLTGSDGNAYVNFHRDRLLDTYAAYKGLGTRGNAWNTLNQKQRDLFLFQTDLLGNRSFMQNVAPVITNEDPCGGEGSDCSGGCNVQQAGSAGLCVYLGGDACVQAGYCYSSPGNRTDFSMALEHVTQMYEILGPNDNCGGDDNNRIFWSADTELIGGFRNYYYGLPMWDTNGDLGGPHAPFDNASSTTTGRPSICDGPDGQAQFYSYDQEAVAFVRGSAYLPADGHMFELDDDYDTVHNSSPECSYCGGRSARSMYEGEWCSRQGNAAPCDWGYAPSP